MSDKDQRFTRLQHDLSDGRIKLPDDHDFKREFLGDWKDDRADAMAYAATATKTVAHRCALCSEVIDCDMSLVESYVTACAAHHAVCPKRPIAVGDYVLWEYGALGPFAKPENWAEGEVTRIDRFHADIRVERCGLAKRNGTVTIFGIGPDVGSTIRRICAPGCQCGAHDQVAGLPPPEPARRVYRPVKVDREAMERAMRDETARRTALIDGLDREACLARWMENRLAVEGHAAPPNAMTRMQIDVGRALWLERYGAARGAELRAKVDAGREAERCRMRVDIQDIDP